MKTFYTIMKRVHGVTTVIDTIYSSKGQALDLCITLADVGDSESLYYIEEA